jgi:two-component system phosphate regulon sensor histidine kinase PhoR
MAQPELVIGVSLLGLTCIFVLVATGIPEGYRHLVAIGVLAVQTLLVLRLVRRLEKTTQGFRESLNKLVMQLRKAGIEPTAATISPGITTTDWGDKYRAVCEEINKILENFRRLKQECATAEVRSQRYSVINQRLNDLMDVVPDPLLLVDASGQIISYNRAARQQLKIRDSLSEDIAGDRDASLFSELLEQVKKKRGVSPSFDWQVNSSGDQTTYYRVIVRDVSTDNGDRPDFSGDRAIFLQDITPLHELRKRHAEFVSAASHEMKAPLAAIRAYTELLLDGEATDEETREQFLSTIETQAQRLQRLVENLLNIARIEAGIMKVHKQPVSVNEILQEAGRLMTAAASEKGITLALELSPLYLPIHVDRDLMLQAVINLISNAIKYTPNNGRVTVRSQLQDSTIVVEVEDTGVGMSPADMERLFEKFYRVEAHKQMAPGTGLGLALTKHIVEDVHGGKISVQSKVNEGSVFAIALPRASAKASPVRMDTEFAEV